MNDYGMLIAMVTGLVIGAVLVILIQHKKIDGTTLSGVAEVMEALPETDGDGIFDLIYKYAKVAVLAVEQMVKTGKIGKSAEERKTAAMDIVKTAAEVDHIEYGKEEGILASNCIEAEVHRLPRNSGVQKAESEPLDEAEEPEANDSAAEDVCRAPAEESPVPEEERAEESAPGVEKAPPDDMGSAE